MPINLADCLTIKRAAKSPNAEMMSGRETFMPTTIKNIGVMIANATVLSLFFSLGLSKTWWEKLVAKNITTMETAIKMAVYKVGLANKMLNMTAVPILVINVDDISILPTIVFDKLVSRRTE